MVEKGQLIAFPVEVDAGKGFFGEKRKAECQHKINTPSHIVPLVACGYTPFLSFVFGGKCSMFRRTGAARSIYISHGPITTGG